MFCSNCNTKLNNDKPYCQKCGKLNSLFKKVNISLPSELTENTFQLIIDELNQDYNLNWEGFQPKRKILYLKKFFNVSEESQFPPIPTRVILLTLITRMQLINILKRLRNEKNEILKRINLKNIVDGLINRLDGKETKLPWVIAHYEETKFPIEIDKADPMSRKDYRIFIKDAHPVFDVELERNRDPQAIPQIISFGYAAHFDLAITAYFVRIENNESEFIVQLLESKKIKFNK